MTALRSDARLAFTRATVFDSTAGCLRPGATVVVRGEQIEDVLFDATPVHDARVVDLAGRSLLPGLIDAHVHITATSARLLDLTSTPPSLVAAQAKDILWGMLMRGFTTVRDAAGNAVAATLTWNVVTPSTSARSLVRRRVDEYALDPAKSYQSEK